jgi:hypothetical protein
MKKLPIALCLSVVFILAGCSSSSSGGSGSSTTPPATTSPTPTSSGATTAAAKAAATAQIKKNWAVFFKTATPHSTAVSLLENGQNLGPAVKFAANIAKTSGTKEAAKVRKVTFTTPTSATVVYTLYGNGKPLLPKADGQAVLVGSTWKVSQATFCALVNLGAAGKKVPGC